MCIITSPSVTETVTWTGVVCCVRCPRWYDHWRWWRGHPSLSAACWGRQRTRGFDWWWSSDLFPCGCTAGCGHGYRTWEKREKTCKLYNSLLTKNSISYSWCWSPLIWHLWLIWLKNEVTVCSWKYFKLNRFQNDINCCNSCSCHSGFNLRGFHCKKKNILLTQ